MDRIVIESRVGWLREKTAELDGDIIRLGQDVRGGTLVDVRAVAARMAAIEEVLQARQDEVRIWRVYLNPPRSRLGRLLFAAGEALLRAARAVG